VARHELVEKEVNRLIKAGYVVKSDDCVELTPAGKALHKKMTTICKKSE
jgi:Mn-dependent DtxR family transcriptional regulator